MQSQQSTDEKESQLECKLHGVRLSREVTCMTCSCLMNKEGCLLVRLPFCMIVQSMLLYDGWIATSRLFVLLSR